MAGTKRAVCCRNNSRETPNFYREIGRVGGSEVKSVQTGFALNREAARIAGRISKRRPAG